MSQGVAVGGLACPGRIAWWAVPFCAACIAVILPTTARCEDHSVRVVPDRTSLSMGQTLSVRIIVEGRPDSVKGPDLSGFDVVGKSTGTSISIVNNQVRQEQTTTLTLSPRQPGKLKIGAVEVIVAGRVASSSRPIPITVGNRGTPGPSVKPPSRTPPGTGKPSSRTPRQVQPVPPAPATADRHAGQKAFLVARAPDRPLYVGEPVYVEYVLYSRSDLSLQGIRVETQPALKGFVVEQLSEAPGRAGQVRMKGALYEAHVQWRGAVTALEAGRVVLDSMEALLFVGDFFTQRRYRLSNDPVQLEFLAPPDQGKPADFVRGTVGKFVVKSEIDKTTIPVGDSALFTVEIAGTGNLRALKAPVIQVGEGMRVSDVPTADLDELRVDRGGVSGKRIFQYLLTPEREGSFEVGRISLSFFNSLSGEYERTRTGITKIVALGRTREEMERETPHRGQVVGIIESLDAVPRREASAPWLDRTVLYAGLLLPVSFLLGVEIWRRRRDYLSTNRLSLARRGALRRAEQGIARLTRGDEGDPARFWADLDQVAREFLDRRFSLRSAGLTHDEVRESLLACGAPTHPVDSLIAELEACAFGRFAPSAAMESDRSESLKRVRKCLKDLDKVGNSR